MVGLRREAFVVFVVGSALLFVAVPTLLLANEFSGRMVRVADGDTIDVLHDGRARHIRLYGVD